jgi:hypothetical protein
MVVDQPPVELIEGIRMTNTNDKDELFLSRFCQQLPNDLKTQRVRVCRDHGQRAEEEIERIITKIADIDTCFTAQAPRSIGLSAVSSSNLITPSEILVYLKQLNWYLQQEWVRFEEAQPEELKTTKRTKKRQRKKNKRTRKFKQQGLSGKGYPRVPHWDREHSTSTPKKTPPKALPKLLRSNFKHIQEDT